MHDFFNTRFQYGKTQCEIIQAAHPFVEVEIFVGATDLPYLASEFEKYLVDRDWVTVNDQTSGRAIMAEYVPVFARKNMGEGIGLVFSNPYLDEPVDLLEFARKMATENGYPPVDLGFDFATAMISVNEELVLLSSSSMMGPDKEQKLEFFKRNFPQQHFYVVPPLAGDLTNDLDMYLWPIAPHAWIVSEYPVGTPQAESIAPAIRILTEHGHTIHRVPGLAPIIYNDINTMPNYANGVIINSAALVPQYNRKEDDLVRNILREYGYQVLPIDCSIVILSNSALHCISKTIPRL